MSSAPFAEAGLDKRRQSPIVISANGLEYKKKIAHQPAANVPGSHP